MFMKTRSYVYSKSQNSYIYFFSKQKWAFKLGILEFLDSGRKSWTLDSGLWTLDAGLCTLSAGLWTLDSGSWTLKTLEARLWTLGIGCWILDVKTLRSTVNLFQANVLFLFNHLKISKTRRFQRFSDDMESELQLEMN